MWIKRLFAKNFRTYNQVEVSFDKGINIIIGENGQGKTNLLEAIHFSITGRSFRTERLIELVQTKNNILHTLAEYEHLDISHKIQLSYGENEKKILHDSTTYPTLSSLTGTVPTITISPSDINIIMGSPQERRRFLNLFIAQHDPIYLHHLSRYQKALKARNALLKRNSKTTIIAYESLLAIHAVAITKARKKAIQELEPIFQNQFSEIMNNNLSLAISYSFKEDPSEAYYLNEYNKNRDQEERLGGTIVGPHRDDCKFFINGLEAKYFSSEGQKRSLLTALKLAELTLLKNKTGLDPVLFIDDFAIHLDLYRCKQLETVIQNYPQVFLTTPQNVFDQGSLYFVQNLKVQKLTSHFV